MPSDESNLEHCALELMGNPLQSQPKLLILSHDGVNQLVSTILKKGTLDEEHAGVFNSILVGFKCRRNTNLVEGKGPHSKNGISLCASPVGEDNNLFVYLSKLVALQIMPLQLLESPMWRGLDSSTCAWGMRAV